MAVSGAELNGLGVKGQWLCRHGVNGEDENGVLVNTVAMNDV